MKPDGVEYIRVLCTFVCDWEDLLPEMLTVHSELCYN
jgi:hypothetical protein